MIQLNVMCTHTSHHHYAALFSPSDVSAGQRGEAVRLNPHSQTNKKTSALGNFMPVEMVFDLHLLAFSPFKSFILNLSIQGGAPIIRPALNTAGLHVDPRPNVLAMLLGFFSNLLLFIHSLKPSFDTLQKHQKSQNSNTETLNCHSIALSSYFPSPN